MDDIDYGELFGVEVKDDGAENHDGEKETVVAEPSGAADTDTKTTESEAGEKEQDVAAPDETAGEEDDGTEKSDGDGKQTPAENAAYAAARRKAEAEKETAIAEAKAEAEKQINDAYRSLGIINPYSGKLITTKAEYDDYKKQYDIDKRKEMIAQTGMSEDEYKKFVNELPEVREAREAKEAAEKAQRAAAEAAAQSRIDEQVKEISTLDPTVKSIDDLKRMENYDRFYDLVKRGNSLVDAYKLANLDRLTKQAAETARRQAINSVSSRSHLDKTSTRGAGTVTVPSDVIEEYRAFNPGITDAEIARHYSAYLKK